MRLPLQHDLLSTCVSNCFGRSCCCCYCCYHSSSRVVELKQTSCGQVKQHRVVIRTRNWFSCFHCRMQADNHNTSNSCRRHLRVNSLSGMKDRWTLAAGIETQHRHTFLRTYNVGTSAKNRISSGTGGENTWQSVSSATVCIAVHT